MTYKQAQKVLAEQEYRESNVFELRAEAGGAAVSVDHGAGDAAELAEANRIVVIVDAAREWARANYTNGGDVIVEAFEADELVDDVLRDAATAEQAVARTKAYCELHTEQALNATNAIGDY